jgi:beta-glucosidase
VVRSVATQLRFQQRIDAVPAGSPADDAGHASLAFEAAVRAITLLTNDGVLPLPEVTTTVALVGALAAQPNLGDRGSSRVHPSHVVTPLDGMRARFGSAVAFDDGTDIAAAAALAAASDVAVVVVGYTHLDEGEYIGLETQAELRQLYPPTGPDTAALLQAAFEKVSGSGQERAMGTGGDRRSLRLHPHDEALLEAVCAANPRTVAVVMSGSAVVMPWVHRAAATVMLWYPGQEGGTALAAVLAGDVAPAGRLPFTVPTDETHLPYFDRDATAITYDRWHGYSKLQRDGVDPAFAFGSGLTYTTFTIGDVAARADDEHPDGHLEVVARVANTGTRPASHVVQVYAGLPGSAVERAERWLVGFTRTPVLEPGESVHVVVHAPLQRLMVWRPATQDWWLEPGDYRLEVSHSSADHAATLSFTLPA